MHTHTYTRSSYFVTRARAQARRASGGKGEKAKETKKKKKKKKKKEKKIFARTTSGDDLREQIDRDAFAMCSYARYMLRGRRRRMRKEKRKAKKWPCSLLVEAKVLTKSPDFIGKCF